MNIFINHAEGRLRAGWRLAAQFFLMYLIGFGLIWLTSLFYTFGGNLLPTALLAAGAVASMILAARGLDQRPWKEFGLHFNKKSRKECALGFALAGLVMALIFGIEYAAGWLTFSGFGWQQFSTSPYLLSFAGYFLWMVIIGVYEEMVYRGYQIVNLSEGLNGPRLSRLQAVIGALVISSFIFGVMHAFNPNADWISTLNIAIAGAMLAFPFIITGRLALSIGLHVGWNFFQGGIFGFPVSGVPGRASVLQMHQKGPDLLTGGGFGPEAGLMGLLGLLLIVAGLLWYFKRSDQRVTVYSKLGTYDRQPSQNST